MFRTVPQLTVKDVFASVDFYRDRLGFSVAQIDPPENPVFASLDREETSLFLVSERSREESYQIDDLSGNKRGVGLRLYFEVDDAQALYDELLATGVAMLRDITYNEAEDYTEFSFSDPDGYEIGIYS